MASEWAECCSIRCATRILGGEPVAVVSVDGDRRSAAPRRLEALQFVRLEVAPAPRIASELVVLVGSARVVVERGFDAELLRAVVEALATKGGT